MSKKKKDRNLKWALPLGLSTLVFILFVAFFYSVESLFVTTSTDKPFVYFGEVGDVFAGLFTTIAFIFLVFGYFQTNKSIELHQDEIRAMRNDLEENRGILRAQVYLSKENLLLEKYKLIESGVEARLLELLWARPAKVEFVGYATTKLNRDGVGRGEFEERDRVDGHNSRSLFFSGSLQLFLSYTEDSHFDDFLEFYIGDPEAGKIILDLLNFIIYATKIKKLIIAEVEKVSYVHDDYQSTFLREEELLGFYYNTAMIRMLNRVVYCKDNLISIIENKTELKNTKEVFNDFISREKEMNIDELNSCVAKTKKP